MAAVQQRWVGVALAFIASACAGSIDDPSKFTNPNNTGGADAGMMMMPPAIDVEMKIFAVKCNTAACHEGPMAASQLDLTSAGVKKRLLNRPSTSCASRTIITKSAPDMSVLLDRISAMPMCGVRMPLGRDPLGADELTAVKLWVEQAATSTATGM